MVPSDDTPGARPGGPGRVVHLVAKAHLDLGFTALASEVEARYLEEFFPRALRVAAELAGRGGPERLVWTTGSWILHRALADPEGARASAVADGVAAGRLAWHALPVTTHTELMDVRLVRSGLGISDELDRRFGRTTTAAKMTDVPGHTRGLVPLLAEAGVTFLHLGVNPAWPVPEVPPAFRWRSPDGSEITVAYQAGGYGGVVEVVGCPDVLAFLHAGDNLGPPTAEEVLDAHADLRARFPGAEVRASTLDAFARALAASGAEATLPVVTAEIGDPWLFGAGSDPQKVAAYRDLLRWRGRLAARIEDRQLIEIDRTLLLVAEHTWGLDQKEVLPTELPWDGDALVALRRTAVGRRFESSWAEQRAYVDRAARQLGAALRSTPEGSGPHHLRAPARTLADRALEVPRLAVDRHGRLDGFEPVDLGTAVVIAGGDGDPASGWSAAVDAATGALVDLRHEISGRQVAGRANPIGAISRQTFDEVDYERFYAQLEPTREDDWWARRDNTKPGIAAAGARSQRRGPDRVEAWTAGPHGGAWTLLVVRLAFDQAGAAPFVVWQQWSDGGDGGEVALRVWWNDKEATRLPEATWCSFVPVVAEPDRWTLDKLGQAVSPLDVVRRGGRSLHAVGEGMAYDGPDGALRISTPDAPLVAPGAPNLLDADPPVPNLAGGLHVLLHDNCWGTNFPMWNEGPASFGFTISVAADA